MKRKGEWHSAWAVPYSIVGVREAIIRAARVSKELIHSALISAAIHRPCRMHTNLWLGGARYLATLHCLYVVTTNAKNKKQQQQKKTVLKGLDGCGMGMMWVWHVSSTPLHEHLFGNLPLLDQVQKRRKPSQSNY